MRNKPERVRRKKGDREILKEMIALVRYIPVVFEVPCRTFLLLWIMHVSWCAYEFVMPFNGVNFLVKLGKMHWAISNSDINSGLWWVYRLFLWVASFITMVYQNIWVLIVITIHSFRFTRDIAMKQTKVIMSRLQV